MHLAYGCLRHYSVVEFQGTLGPDLASTGSRWSEGQLRLRIVDAAGGETTALVNARPSQ
jgi:hypothetical protein